MTATAPTARRWKKSDRSLVLVRSWETKGVDSDARTFEGALSSSHLDLGNGWLRDIVWPGAFKRWVGQVKAGAYVPLIDSHNRFTVMAVYGHLIEAQERLTGKTLEVPMEGGKLAKVPEMFLDTKWQVIDGPDGDRLLDRLRPGSVRKMSMGYDPLKSDFARLADGQDVRNLREVKVEEGSLVIFPMNPAADVDLTTVKALPEIEALTSWAREAKLEREQLEQLAALDPELKAALAGAGLLTSAEELEHPAPKGLDPEDPKRQEQADLLRTMTLRRLEAGG